MLTDTPVGGRGHPVSHGVFEILEPTRTQVAGHSTRTKEWSLRIAAALDVLDRVEPALVMGALLHDVGKFALPASVVNKPGSLTISEWELIRKHPVIGERMLRDVDFAAPALPVIRHHHERWDGHGYPDRLTGTDIPLAARIVSVCDAFDAMTNDRPYRQAIPIGRALDRLIHGAGSQFDPECIEVLVNVVGISELGLGGTLRPRPQYDLERRAS